MLNSCRGSKYFPQETLFLHNQKKRRRPEQSGATEASKHSSRAVATKPATPGPKVDAAMRSLRALGASRARATPLCFRLVVFLGVLGDRIFNHKCLLPLSHGNPSWNPLEVRVLGEAYSLSARLLPRHHEVGLLAGQQGRLTSAELGAALGAGPASLMKTPQPVASAPMAAVTRRVSSKGVASRRPHATAPNFCSSRVPLASRRVNRAAATMWDMCSEWRKRA